MGENSTNDVRSRQAGVDQGPGHGGRPAAPVPGKASLSPHRLHHGRYGEPHLPAPVFHLFILNFCTSRSPRRSSSTRTSAGAAATVRYPIGEWKKKKKAAPKPNGDGLSPLPPLTLSAALPAPAAPRPAAGTAAGPPRAHPALV